MNSVKTIALYFPQFHEIEENNRWWGKGFTDWANVKKTSPLYQGHYQPRVPLDKNYYNQADLEVLRWQSKLAKQYGIYGFCHYHYWFEGQQLLQTPTDLMLDNQDIDMPFCLSWANETWSRRWDGKDHQILIKQTHTPSRALWSEHFDYLIHAWMDKRAIRIDDKPVFIIYRPNLIDNVDEMLEFWQTQAKSKGLKGVYFIFQKQYEHPDKKVLQSFDALFQFQPFEAIYSSLSQHGQNKTRLKQFVDRLPRVLQGFVWSLWAARRSRHTTYSYDEIWQACLITRDEPGLKTFHGAFVDWDNTSRYAKKATLFEGATPESFGYWFHKLVSIVSKKPSDEQYIFINAWNEWAEGAYLEPDERYGYQYLDQMKSILDAINRE